MLSAQHTHRAAPCVALVPDATKCTEGITPLLHVSCARCAALLTGCSFCHFTYPRPVDDCRLSRLRLRPGAHLTGKRSWQGSSRASLLGHRATRHAMVRKGDRTRPSAVTTTLRLPPRQQLGIPTYSTPWCPKPGAFPQPSKVFVQGVSLSSPPPHPPAPHTPSPHSYHTHPLP